MKRLSTFALTSAAALGFASLSHAADFQRPGLGAVPPVLAAQPAPVDTGGWYLRGDIGVGVQNLGSFTVANSVGTLASQVNPTGVGEFTVNQYEKRSHSVSEATFIGAGIGYAFNSWLRADITGEWRGGARLNGSDYIRYVGAGGTTGTDNITSQTNVYSGNVRSLVFLANAYVDLGTFCVLGCVTPFLGAGVGVANNQVSGFTDTSSGFNSTTGALGALGGYASTAQKTNFAWALHAGLAYQVNNRLTLELAYRYLNLGNLPDIQLRDYATGALSTNGNVIRGAQLQSHDVKLGMRWSLNGDCCRQAEPAPLVVRN